MAQMAASRAVKSSRPAPVVAPPLDAAATSSMALPIMARRPSTVEHMIETIGQTGHDRDGFRPLRTAARRPGPPVLSRAPAQPVLSRAPAQPVLSRAPAQPVLSRAPAQPVLSRARTPPVLSRAQAARVGAGPNAARGRATTVRQPASAP